MPNSSIWTIHRTLSGATSPVQRGPGSNSNEGVLHISQVFKAGALSSDCSIVVGSYPSVEMQSVYSTAPADWDDCFIFMSFSICFKIFFGGWGEIKHFKLKEYHSKIYGTILSNILSACNYVAVSSTRIQSNANINIVVYIICIPEQSDILC